MSYFRSTAGRVVSCVLYLIAGVGTAGLVFLVMEVHRRGAFLAGDISFVGSGLLVVAAVMVLFSSRGTGYIALTGIVAVWVFYFYAFLSFASEAARAGKTAAEIVLLILALLLFIASVTYPIASIVSLRGAET